MVARRRAEEEEKEEVATASQSDWAVHRASGRRLRASGLAGCRLVVRGHSEETAAAAEDHARSAA